MYQITEDTLAASIEKWKRIIEHAETPELDLEKALAELEEELAERKGEQ